MTRAPDAAAARAFLHRIDPEADFITFQTFDESAAKRKTLARIVHADPANGAIDTLAKLNEAQTAGVYFTVNATDGQGRQAHNVQRVRAVFLDLDGAPLAPVLEAGLDPHIVVESSPGKYHVYWLTDDCPLDQFERVQRALARRFGGDPSVHDLPRVLRVPGFLHRKGEPFLVHTLDGIGTTAPPYALAEIVAALKLELDAPEQTRQRPAPDAVGRIGEGNRHAHLFRLGRSMAKKGLSREAVAAALAAENATRCDPPLAPADVDYLARRAFTAKDAQGWQDAPLRDDQGSGGTQPLDGDPNAPPSDPRSYDVTLIRGDSVEPVPIRWIWNGWLAAGKFHVLAGSPGVGKSTIALALAATITSGGRWPDGTRAAPGNVLIWSGEDDPADTLVPRLIASGADISRIWFVGDVREGDGRVAFDPARHMGALELQATRVGGVTLVMVDPVVSAVVGDSHKNAEVRRSLQPLVDLATRLDCAMLGISHFTKGTAGRDPTERVTGSLAFGALARVVLVAAKLPADDGGKDDRILARAKCNIGIDVGGFGYSIEQTELDRKPGLFASRVLWGEVIDGTARELLADAESHDDGERSQTDEARAWLTGVLSTGSMKASDVQREARQAGISEKALRRARERLGIRPQKDSFSSGWRWALRPGEDAQLATKMPKVPEDAQTICVGTFDDGGHLRGDRDLIEVEF